MNTVKIWICSTTLMLWSAAGLAAQEAPPSCPPPKPDLHRSQPGKGEAQGRKWFDMLDSDGDGRISRAEARAAFFIKPSLKEWFDNTDTDGDGYLTEQEVREAADRKRAERLRKRYEQAVRDCAAQQAHEQARAQDAADKSPASPAPAH